MASMQQQQQQHSAFSVPPSSSFNTSSIPASSIMSVLSASPFGDSSNNGNNSNNNAEALSSQEHLIARLAQDIGLCSLCHQKYTAPRFLHCMHVFCYKCLSAIVSGNTIICSKCHFETVLGPEGLSDPSLVVPEMIDLIREGRNVCEECLQERAHVHCRKCDAPLCTNCFEKTHSSRLFRTHKVDVIGEDGNTKRNEPRCESHPEERIKFVCTTDHALLCRDCVLMGGYKNENYVSVEEASEHAKSLIKFLIDRAKERLETIENSKKSAAGVLPELDREYENLVDRVKVRGQRMGDAISARRDSLLKEANELKELKVARLMDQNEKLLATLAAIDNAKLVYRQLYDLCSDFECLEIMGEIEKSMQAMIGVNIPSHPVAEGSFLTQLDDSKLEGHISSQRSSHLSEAVLQDIITVNALIYAIGGNDGKLDLNTVERYDIGNDTWTAVPPMSCPRRAPAAAVINGLVYVIGGWDGKQHLDSMECYEPSREVWLSMPYMSTPRNGLGVAALNGKIYAIGGYDGKANLDTVERFDPFTNQWLRVANMRTKRRGCCAAVLLGKLYVLGGYDGSRHHTSVERYDAYGNIWINVASMNVPRKFLATAVVGGKLYAIGGWDGARALDSVERYDPFTNTWTEVSPMPTKRQGAAAVVCNGRIFVMGGWDGLALRRLETVEQYDPNTNRWTIVSPMRSPRFGLAASIL